MTKSRRGQEFGAWVDHWRYGCLNTDGCEAGTTACLAYWRPRARIVYAFGCEISEGPASRYPRAPSSSAEMSSSVLPLVESPKMTTARTPAARNAVVITNTPPKPIEL